MARERNAARHGLSATLGVAALVLSFVESGCGGDSEPSASSSATSTGSGPSAPQPLGYSCAANEHCDSGTCTSEDSFQFCGASCEGGAACPPGGVCVDSALCLPACTTDADCAGTFDDSAPFYAGKATGGGKCLASEGACWPATDQ